MTVGVPAHETLRNDEYHLHSWGGDHGPGVKGRLLPIIIRNHGGGGRSRKNVDSSSAPPPRRGRTQEAADALRWPRGGWGGQRSGQRSPMFFPSGPKRDSTLARGHTWGTHCREGSRCPGPWGGACPAGVRTRPGCSRSPADSVAHPAHLVTGDARCPGLWASRWSSASGPGTISPGKGKRKP